MGLVLVAPDSFKQSVSAVEAARALAAGWRDARPADAVIERPMADGGEGTLDAFAAAVPGVARRSARVAGPDGRPVDARWLALPDGTAVVELAQSSGLGLLAHPAPLDAHTRGLGETLRAALAEGARRLVVAVGGSASTDGGAGVLTALGARLTDADGRPIADGGRGLDDLDAVDLTALVPPPPDGVEVLVDVTSPLLGPTGAAAVFGPQKGASSADVETLERGLARLAVLLPTLDPTTPGAAAAGGTAFGLLAWGARLVPGAETVARLLGLGDLSASVVVTGEGAFDRSSAAGKAPATVAQLVAPTPTLLVAGRIEADADTSAFADAISLTELAGSAAASLADPLRWLRQAGALMARRNPPLGDAARY